MRTLLTDKIKHIIIKAANLNFRKEVSAISEVQRYMKLLELYDSRKAEELVTRISNKAIFNTVTAESIINQIKEELDHVKNSTAKQ